jgi:outer membrane biosynthesis protein TonB
MGTIPSAAPAMQPQKQVPDNPNAADINFTKELHDFGTIDQGANGTTEFTFKNTGKEPLIIQDAKGSCGCTVPSYPKEPIKPGATGTIKVTYDTKRVGAFTKTVTITSNAKSGTKTLTIKGNVKATSDEDTFPAKKVSAGTPVEGK